MCCLHLRQSFANIYTLTKWKKCAIENLNKISNQHKKILDQHLVMVSCVRCQFALISFRFHIRRTMYLMRYYRQHDFISPSHALVVDDSLVKSS